MPSGFYNNEKFRRRPWNLQLLLKLSIGFNILLLATVFWTSLNHGSSRTAAYKKLVLTNATSPGIPKCTNISFLELNVEQQRRYFQDQFSNISDLVIPGWLTPANALMALAILRAQTRACITGSVGEIGVHHGKHLIPMALSTLPHESILALDLFEKQELNVDKSGMGNRTHLANNLARYGVPPERVVTIEADSSQLKPGNIAKMKLPKFRFLSVDGGHTYDLTMSDLKLASALIQPGGVIALDDVPNIGWIGVQEAMYDFLSLNRSIAPFLYSCQKMYFTTADYHEQYVKLANQLPCGVCTFALKYHPSRYSIRDWPMCVKATQKTGKGGSDACVTCGFEDLPLTTLALPAQRDKD